MTKHHLWLLYFTADGEDYSIDSTTVSVETGKMSKLFAINIIDDNITECDVTFKLTLSVPASACGAVNGKIDSTEVTIIDNGRTNTSQWLCVIYTLINSIIVI